MALRAKTYFRDYDLEETVGPDGRVKREYVYRGDLYERDLPEQKQAAERLWNACFGILAALLLVLVMLCDVPANKGGVFSALSILALIPAFCVVVGAILSFFKKGKLTKNDYHERLLLLRVMPLLGSALLLAMTVGYLIDAAFDAAPDAWIAAGVATVCALLYAAIGIRELRVKYIVRRGTKPSVERKGLRDWMKEEHHG